MDLTHSRTNLQSTLHRVRRPGIYLVPISLSVAVLLWWHWLIPFEERSMVEGFGDEYDRYMQRTGRFFPRIGKRQAT